MWHVLGYTLSICVPDPGPAEWLTQPPDGSTHHLVHGDMLAVVIQADGHLGCEAELPERGRRKGKGGLWSLTWPLTWLAGSLAQSPLPT